MMTCVRCGIDTPRLIVDQRYCPPCDRDVRALTTPQRAPSFVPVWRRNAQAKDLTEALVR